MIDIDSKYLAKKFFDVLGAVLRIVARTPVTHSDIEEAVRSELHHAAIMVLVRLWNREQNVFGGVCHVRITRRYPVFGDDRRAIGPAGVVHIETPIR